MTGAVTLKMKRLSIVLIVVLLTGIVGGCHYAIVESDPIQALGFSARAEGSDLFDMDAVSRGLGLTRSYSRQRQLTGGLEWAGRKPLPAACSTAALPLAMHSSRVAPCSTRKMARPALRATMSRMALY